MSYSPFESTKYYILLALAVGPQHGLAIQSQIVDDGLGLYVRSSTIYGALKAMTRDGLIEEADPGTASYRREFRITEKGRRKLKLESQTLERTVRLARERV
jgi:DNA-binding PadR family transcriptional regulator